MGNKKADVYTRTGDQGTTGLFGGTRVDKDSMRVEAYGTLDELAALIGVVKTQDLHPCSLDVLSQIQGHLYHINAEIASDEKGINKLTKKTSQEAVTFIEGLINSFDAKLPKLTHFIVPSDKSSAATLNLARTVCRRAERRLWTLARTEQINPLLITFINRLSDLLFTLMRFEGLAPNADPAQ
jgi:cob(I)alamin adenosyltransferase